VKLIHFFEILRRHTQITGVKTNLVEEKTAIGKGMMAERDERNKPAAIWKNIL
jgi:hypothetical protein